MPDALDLVRALEQSFGGASGRVALMTELRRLCVKGRFDEAGQALASADLARLDEQSVMMLVRSTYPWRSRIEDWPATRDRVADDMRRRGRSVPHVMVGLLEDPVTPGVGMA